MRIWKQAPSADRMLISASLLCMALSMSLLFHSPGAQARAKQDEEFLRFVDLAHEIYTEIQAKYVDEVERTELLEAALQGMFRALDEHSQYMDPRTLENLNKDTGGSFSGIGIHITQRQGLLTVIAPIPGSPAARIGLQPWDRIIEIDGESSEGMTLTDAVDRLTGPTGTEVTIKVFRDSAAEPLEFTIVRAQIKIESVHWRMMDDNIGYARIARFSESTGADLRRGLLDLKSQGMESLILDLRFNTGGLLRQAIEVSDLFVPKPEIIVSTKGRLRSHNTEHRAEMDPIVDVPVFVLVNEGSASASEIVAGALQDHKIAVLIGPEGKNTFGKGSVQTIESLRHSMYEDENGNPKESAIRFTTARYYTPSGRTIHHTGITPDIGIPMPRTHEGELLRRGLYGDTTIPLTTEEQEARDRRLEQIEQNRLDLEDESNGTGVRLQTEEPAAQPEATGDPNEPFYVRAKRPELAEGTFNDILLDEAVKQMKIFMILERNRRARPASLAGIARDRSAQTTK